MYPSFGQFSRWAAQHTAIPLWIEPELPPGPLLEWAHQLHAEHSSFFLLHSASSGPPIASLGGQQARYSYVALDQPRYSVECEEGSLTVRYNAEAGGGMHAIKIGNPIDRFHEWFSHLSGPRVDGLPPFWGGAVGYFSYESARFLDPKLGRLFQAKRSRASALATDKFPEFEFGVFDAVVVIDHARQRCWLVHTVFLPEGKTLAPQQLEKIYRSAQDRLRRYAVSLQKALHAKTVWGTFQTSAVRSNRSAAAYQLMVRRAKGYIASGDIYQSNLSHAFFGTWEGDPWTLYRRLSSINPSPYAALWRSGARWMVSASPELLIRQEADKVETRPIAGTYPRDPSLEIDPAVTQPFLQDAKEKAEHIMLVDLARNDLSRICSSPSVKVAESLAVEAYSHVIHLVSDVRGELMKDKRWKDVLQACFPAGTITGCPKIRSMERIQRLEAQRRGPYTGSLGWIGFSGDMTMNILIRTFFLDKTKLAFPVGAGIVADSDPRREYDETLHKARALLHAVQREGPSRLHQKPR
jgi:anthranilate/para-aminobenzoate synthase component I